MPSAVAAQLTPEPAPPRPQDRRRRPSAVCPLRSALRALSLLPSLLSLVDRAAVAKGRGLERNRGRGGFDWAETTVEWARGLILNGFKN